MANFDIPEKPVLSTEMRRLETTDPSAAELFNGMFGQLLENDAFMTKHTDNKENPHGITAEQVGAEAMSALDDITTDDTILETVIKYYNRGIKSGRFFSPNNVSDNPEENWNFGIEYFDVGRSLVLVRAFKTQVHRSYFRQIDCETGDYLYDWVCDYNSSNRPSSSDVEAITYGTNRIYINENDDLNNYTSCGCYKCMANMIAETLANVPVKKAFTLDVIPGTGEHDKIDMEVYSYIVQKITTIDGDQYCRDAHSNPSTGETIFGDWKNTITGANVINNLATTEEGFVLDARQGKALNDKIVKLEGNSLRTYTTLIATGKEIVIKAGNLQPFNGFISAVGVGPNKYAMVPLWSYYPYYVFTETDNFRIFMEDNGKYLHVKSINVSVYVCVASDNNSGIVFEEVAE